MHYSAYVNAEKFYEKYCKDNIQNKKILDVGSYDVNGTMKPIFEKGQYVGLDMEEGPNVDVVGVSHDIPFEENEFDIVISSSCFEHDDMFWVSFQEMCRVLKDGGYMYIQAPSNGPYHGWPGDNWRFYIDSWKALEKWGKKLGYDIELVEHYIDETTPAGQNEGRRIWNDSIGIFKKKDTKKKKLVLISSYCDNNEKVEVLKENISVLKEMGLDVLVISPVSLPDEVRELSDFLFYTKENPILNWPHRAFTFWKKILIDGENVTMQYTTSDYGWAALYQVKKLSQIALTYDYDIFYHIIYDLDIDDEVKREINSNEINLIHPRIKPTRPNEKWETTLHFMVFNRESMEKVINMIDFDSYKKLTGFAEDESLKWANQIPLTIKEHPVKDKIYYWGDTDFFNYTPDRPYRVFFNKSDKPHDKYFRLCIHDVEFPQTLKVNINNEEYVFEISQNKVYEFNAESQNISKILIEDSIGTMDLTDEWIKCGRNLISFEKEQ